MTPTPMRWRQPRCSLRSATARRGARRCCAMLRRVSPVFAFKRAGATPHDRITPLTWRKYARAHHTYNAREVRISCCSVRDECAVRTLFTKIARVLATAALHKSTTVHKTLGLTPHTGAQRATHGGLSHDRSARAVRFREFDCFFHRTCWYAAAQAKPATSHPKRPMRSTPRRRKSARGASTAAQMRPLRFVRLP